MRNPVATAVVFEGGLALLAIGIAALLGWPSPLQPAAGVARSIGIQLVFGVVAAVPMIGAFLLLEEHPSGPFADVRQEAADLAVGLFRKATVGQLLLVSAVAGIGEELLFRGLLMGGLMQGAGVGVAVALALSSGIFGLAHPISRGYAVLAAAVGLYLGAIYLWSGGVLAPIVTHGLYDFVALCYLLREPVDEAGRRPDVERLDETEAASGEGSEQE